MISISKKLIILVICIGVLFLNVYAVVTPTRNFYVNDYASLLSATTEQYIINVNSSLESQTGAQVVVVTVPNLEGRTLEEYATTLFRQFGIGDKEKNNGVLLLLALEERQFRVEVGYGLEGVLNDSKTGRIQDDYIIPHLKNDKWDEGVKNGFDAIMEEICKEYNVTVGSDKPIPQNNGEGFGIIFFAGSFITGIIVGIVTHVKKFNSRKKIIIIVIMLAMVCVTGICIARDKSNGFMMGTMGMFVSMMGFSMCYGNSGRGSYYGGGFSSGSRGGFSGGSGYSGGGGRSGGGGSSRSF